MPRAAGQIDETKTNALLDAAGDLFRLRGAAVTMDEIARAAGVSKQTLYNRFASKVEIARALASRRSDAATAPLRGDGDPVTVLAAFALGLLTKICSAEPSASLRGVALMSAEAPEIARAVYEAGPLAGKQRLAEWLQTQTAKGLLAVDDPMLAAEMFTGMALGHGHLKSVLGLEQPAAHTLAYRARIAAERFVRAYAPQPGEADVETR